MERVQILENPYMPDWKDARHYQIKIINKNTNSELITFFSQGKGIEKPARLDHVLDCLASDADCDVDFEDWCDGLGYDADSIKARTIWNNCTETSRKLKELLGHKQYRFLLEEVERL